MEETKPFWRICWDQLKFHWGKKFYPWWKNDRLTHSLIVIAVALAMILFSVMLTCKGGIFAPLLGIYADAEDGTSAKKATIQFISFGMGGVIAAIVAAAINNRARAQMENNKLIEKGHDNERFENMTANLGHGKITVRISTFYRFYHLAENNKGENPQKLKEDVFEMLCSYLRAMPDEPSGLKKKNKDEYNKERETLFYILFKDKFKSNSNGLMPDDFPADLKRINLSEMTLSGANLSCADLSNANLLNANLLNANLSGANLSGAKLSGTNLAHAKLSNADLSFADLSQANLLDTNLVGANLWHANLSGAKLSRADISGADFSGANLSDTDLSGEDFSGASLSDADFSNTHLSDTNFSNANLADANFLNTALSDANLSNSNLSGVNFSNASLPDADLSDADLSRANLADAHLADANLANANLSGANLSGAYLANTNLANANLSNTNLSTAYFVGATLQGVQLKGANLQDVSTVEKTDFRGATVDDKPILSEHIPNDKGEYYADWNPPPVDEPEN